MCAPIFNLRSKVNMKSLKPKKVVVCLMLEHKFAHIPACEHDL